MIRVAFAKSEFSGRAGSNIYTLLDENQGVDEFFDGKF
jgi:hypothetical protein